MGYRDDHQAVLLALDAAQAELRLERRRRELAEAAAAPAKGGEEGGLARIWATVLIFAGAMGLGGWLLEGETLKESGFFAWPALAASVASFSLAVIHTIHRFPRLFFPAAATTGLVLALGVMGPLFGMTRGYTCCGGCTAQDHLSMQLVGLLEASGNLRIALSVVALNTVVLAVGCHRLGRPGPRLEPGPLRRWGIAVAAHLVAAGLVYWAATNGLLHGLSPWGFVTVGAGLLTLELAVACAAWRPDLRPLAVGAIVLLVTLGALAVCFDTIGAADAFGRGMELVDRLWLVHQSFVLACGHLRLALPVAALCTVVLLVGRSPRPG